MGGRNGPLRRARTLDHIAAANAIDLPLALTTADTIRLDATSHDHVTRLQSVLSRRVKLGFVRRCHGDAVRKRLFGVSETVTLPETAYRADTTKRVYELLSSTAE